MTMVRKRLDAGPVSPRDFFSTTELRALGLARLDLRSFLARRRGDLRPKASGGVLRASDSCRVFVASCADHPGGPL